MRRLTEEVPMCWLAGEVGASAGSRSGHSSVRGARCSTAGESVDRWVEVVSGEHPTASGDNVGGHLDRPGGRWTRSRTAIGRHSASVRSAHLTQGELEQVVADDSVQQSCAGYGTVKLVTKRCNGVAPTHLYRGKCGGSVHARSDRAGSLEHHRLDSPKSAFRHLLRRGTAPLRVRSRRADLRGRQNRTTGGTG
jgi:hypothetical protein